MESIKQAQKPLDIERNNDIVSLQKNGRVIPHHAMAAIHYALYDILGKTLKVPLYALLGGLYRSKVLVSVEVPRGTPEEMAAHSLEYYKQGIRGIQAKVGSDPDRDAKSLKAIREAPGGRLARAVDIPLEADESADSLYQVFQILKNDSCDLINTKCSNKSPEELFPNVHKEEINT